MLRAYGYSVQYDNIKGKSRLLLNILVYGLLAES
jgi:hypothetical protein